MPPSQAAFRATPHEQALGGSPCKPDQARPYPTRTAPGQGSPRRAPAARRHPAPRAAAAPKAPTTESQQETIIISAGRLIVLHRCCTYLCYRFRMDIILCGTSAWEYWRTPPELRAVEIPLEIACCASTGGLGLPKSLVTPRANANEVESIIRPRLLKDLKGLSLPVHAMLADPIRHKSKLIFAHRKHPLLERRNCIELGGGLWVTDPTFTLATSKNAQTAAELAYSMTEACGLYCRMPRTDRLAWTYSKMLETQDNSHVPRSSTGCNAYSDADGRAISFVDTHGNPLHWSPATTRNGTSSNLWKRPPLTNRQDLLLLTEKLRGQRDSVLPRQAANMCLEGSGSPFETKVALMLTCSVYQGGEGWERPSLNRVIPFSEEAQTLAEMPYCIGDMVWPAQRVCLECNGMAFHADRQGFKVSSGRSAALRSSGYTVLEISYDQFANLEKLDAMSNQFAAALGFPLKKRTVAFLRRREALHSQLVRL